MDKILVEEGQKCGFGDFAVSVVPHFRFKLSDGTHLSIKIWFPSESIPTSISAESFIQYSPEGGTSNADPPHPMILEHLPYRKSDFTLPRDFRRHTWMCSHGYVVLRSDSRGNGDSEGFYYDEYEQTELNDACEIIEWCAAQPWCNGRVGMYGKSWGGFNGLQVAFQQPPALKTIITLYSTDDRYATDCHYMGGCVLGASMLGWSAVMLGKNAQPPHPGHVNVRPGHVTARPGHVTARPGHVTPGWQDTWVTRLQELRGPFVQIWLAHQTRDAYWRHGSVCEVPARMQIPILAIGGFNDGYRDAMLRMVETFPNARGIVGPWCHDWPDCSRPGPHIDFMLECKQWWDAHLKEVNAQAAMSSPLLRLYLQEATPPSAQPPSTRPGRWVKLNSHSTGHHQLLIPDGKTGSLLLVADNAKPPHIKQTTEHAHFSAACGMATCDWFTSGQSAEPGDQRTEDAHSLTWTSEPLADDVNVLGNPELECCVSADKDQAQIAVRLVDVFPDGGATLISFGVLNLTHREGHSPEVVKRLIPGHKYKVRVKLRAASYVVPAGHRIRLALSPSYFPMIWPSREKTTLEITTGSETTGNIQTVLRLPTYPSSKGEIPQSDDVIMENIQSDDVIMANTENPQMGPPLPTEVLRSSSYERYAIHGLADPVYKFITDNDEGRVYLKQTGTIVDTHTVSTCTLEERKPLSATTHIKGHVKIEYPGMEGGVITSAPGMEGGVTTSAEGGVTTSAEGGVTTSADYETSMRCDYDNFYTDTTLCVTLNGEVIHQKTWNDVYAREYV